MASPNSVLNAALREAETVEQILSALASVEYRKLHPGRDCPEKMIPNVADFMAFKSSLTANDKDWPDTIKPFNERMVECVAAVGLDRWRAHSNRMQKLDDALRAKLGIPEGESLAVPPEHGEEWGERWMVLFPHQVWVEAIRVEPGKGIKHPWGEIVRVWLENAGRVEAETRPDKRILPRITGGDEHPALAIGSLFRGLHDSRTITQPELPLWPGVPSRKRVPILDVVDEAGVPVVQRGGAPVELRLFVRTLSAVPMWARSQRTSFQLPLRARDLLDALWPVSPTTGRRTWRVGEHWPKLRHALLTAREYAIHDGRGRWFPLGLRYLPDALMRDNPDAALLDELVVLDVAFPEGATSGPPVVLPVMDRLMVESAARWRAFIAAHCIAWIPGTTRVPVMAGPGGRRNTGRHTWARDVSAYPVLTRADMRRLAFGNDPRHSPTAKVRAAFRGLPGLVVLDAEAHDERTGEVGYRIVPEAAAEAIGRKG